MATRKCFTACFAAACILGAGRGLSASAVLSGGSFSVPVLAALSGGAPASGGAFSLLAVNMGGPVFSGGSLSGGVFSLDSGATQAVIIYGAARVDLGAAHCYPVPYKPSAGHLKITFTSLTRAARVRIFTLSGELVRALEKSDSGDSTDWDVKNTRGENAASGVYFFTVKSAGQTRTGKLMILR
ncbi:MAG: T9SS type A sorting domain-containing protein [Elusimicrobiota bacterium]|nr:T9SS type A sorting domain-containing protein [Elusimicrobiota bacterium]